MGIQPCPWFWWVFSLSKISFLHQDETSPNAAFTCCPLSSPRGFLWRERLCPICSHPLSTRILWCFILKFRINNGDNFSTLKVKSYFYSFKSCLLGREQTPSMDHSKALDKSGKPSCSLCFRTTLQLPPGTGSGHCWGSTVSRESAGAWCMALQSLWLWLCTWALS